MDKRNPMVTNKVTYFPPSGAVFFFVAFLCSRRETKARWPAVEQNMPEAP